MKVLFLFWDLTIFDRYHEQIKLIAEFCENFNIVYFKGTPKQEWLPYYDFVRVTQPTGKNRYARWLGSLQNMFEEIKQLDIDLIYVLSGIWFQVAAVVFSKGFDVPTIVRLRGNDIEAGYSLRSLPNRLIYHLLYFNSFPLHDMIIPINENILEVTDFYRVKNQNISMVVPNGVDLSQYNPVYNKNPVPVFGFIGRLSPEKGADIFIELATQLDDLQFVFAGWDNGLQLPVNVVNMGVLRKDQVHGFYDAIDFVLMPSKTEAFPNVILEAYASGKQIIINRETMPEWVKLFGYSVRVNKLFYWRYIVEKVAYMKNQASRDSRTYAEDVFSWAGYQKSMKEIFYGVLNNE